MNTAIMDGDNFNRLVAATEKFCSKGDNNRPIMQMVRIDFKASTQEACAVALDGYRLSQEHSICLSADGDFSIFISPRTRVPKKYLVQITLNGDEVLIRSDSGSIIGFKQPDASKWVNTDTILADAQAKQPQYTIGFNPNYLLDALYSARASNAGIFRSVVKMEVRDPIAPIIMRTNDNKDIKLVLPVRIYN